MQGCHLRCRYCHNPDTWNRDAGTAREYSPEAIMQIIGRSLPFIKSSGGGVTFSGGEPLLQAEFVRAVFTSCTENNIHTAIDTSLYVASQSILELLPVTQLFLADIKHINNQKSIDLVGAANRCNIENLRIISDYGTEIWIRYVVVPGLTDAVEDLSAMADFVAGLESVTRVDLLPYHSLGSHKWQLLGINYELDGVSPPPQGRMQELQALVEGISKKTVLIPG